MSKHAPLLILLILLFASCQPNAVRYPAPTSPTKTIGHDLYEHLLSRYLTESGEVDYGKWQKNETDVAALDRYLGQLTSSPPTLRPKLYDGSSDKLSYWINLYNALVVREVLRRWPLNSVRDYRPTLTSKFDTTKGFFRDLRFVVGGKEMSLDDIEHATIRKQFDDARVHFALNCGSSSCPVLQPKAYSGAKLEMALQNATVEFLNSPENVRVDTKRQRIYLSKIFKWYGSDFKKHARRATGNDTAGVLDFVTLFAEPELRASLGQARERDFRVVYAAYDWSVNEGAVEAEVVSTAKPTRQDFSKNPLPTLDVQLVDGTRFEHTKGKALIISFWATYCAPCRNSLPHLQSIADKHKDSLDVLALSGDDSRAKVEDFLATQELTLKVAFGDRVNELMEMFAVKGLPTELFVDAKGNIRFSLKGAASDAQLDAALAELLQE